MKPLLLILSVTILICVHACKKKDLCKPITTTAPANEVATLTQYITSNGISATKDARGFYYKIVKAGDTTNKPTICSSVKVAYTGSLIDGTVFDQSTGVSFQLMQLITGWQAALPLIGKGGFIKIYLPPSLGYGSASTGSIPANSILIFDIELQDFR